MGLFKRDKKKSPKELLVDNYPGLEDILKLGKPKNQKGTMSKLFG